MAIQRVQDFVMDYILVSFQMIDCATVELLKYDTREIVKLRILYPLDCYVDGKFDAIAKDLNGLEEIELLWSIYCGHLYSRGGYKDTIYAVVREITYKMRYIAIDTCQQKINTMILERRNAIADVIKLPEVLIIYIGNYLYPTTNTI